MGLHWQKYGKSLYPKHAPHTAAPLLSAAAILAVQPPRTLVLAPLEGEGGVLPVSAGCKGAKADSLPSPSSEGGGGEPT